MQNSGERRDDLDALAEFLAEAEPFLRQHLRSLRGRKHPLLSTSELHGAVVERMVRIEAAANSRGTAEPSDRDPPDGSDERRWQRWALLLMVARRTVTDARELVAREKKNPEPPPQAILPELTEEELRDARTTIESLLGSLDPIDRSLIQLRIRGQNWKAIAAAVGLGEPACRQRWVRVLGELRTRYGS